MGSGPVLLLIHGTGASTHSWRDMAPRLAARFTVIAPDLPGHAFTENPGRRKLSLPRMAEALGELLQVMEVVPELCVGHSAGAAILVDMCLTDKIQPKAVISLNGALLPLAGLAGQIFSPLARLLAANPLVPQFFAWRASNPDVVARLLRGTGSKIDANGADLYQKLVSDPGHAKAALDMMASWELGRLERALPKLKQKLILVVGTNDRTVRPSCSYSVHAMVPQSKLIRLRGLGHLAHEERPEKLCSVIFEAAACVRVLPAD